MRLRLVAIPALLSLCLTGCRTLSNSDTVQTYAISPLTSKELPLSEPEGSKYPVQWGDTLWGIAQAFGLKIASLKSANKLSHQHHLRAGQNLFIPLPRESRRFFWPLYGQSTVTAENGLKIKSGSGSPVRAARSGRIAVATDNLSGFGKTVIIDHLDGYLTIYAGLEDMSVQPGADIRQGIVLGHLGENALHFEIRYGNKPRNAAALLPLVNS
jgi:murein DD-endopeptidase MepM/ murein hydrolase activator NlpD